MNKQSLNTITLTLAVHALNQADPTRTAMLVRSLERQMMLRFARIKQAIRKAIVEQDVFGLKPAVYADIPGKKAFAFTRTDDKVLAFMDWLREQTNKDLLQLGFMSQSGQAINQAWMNTYIEDSYKRGVQRARYELKKAGYDVPTLEATGGIGASLATPFHADRLGVLYTRAFNELKGITENMNTQISRVLTEGMMNGDGPAVIARKLQAVISGGGADLGITNSLGRFIPAERRARMLARTEMIRAHHMATIQEYKNWGLEGVKVQAEWSTAGDGRVCEKCSSLEGKVYDLNVIEGMIPAHPNCRCLALPLLVEGKEVEKPISKANEGITEDSYNKMISHNWYQKEKKFDNLEHETINIYSERGYYINSKLRDANAILNEADSAFIHNLDVSLENLPNYKGIVYRGQGDMDGSYLQMLKNNIGKDIIWKGYTSTSKSLQMVQDAYLGGNSILYKIKSKTGKDIMDFASVKGEEEVLFKRGVKFRIESIGDDDVVYLIEL